MHMKKKGKMMPYDEGGGMMPYDDGGGMAASKRNPNKHSMLNETPCGPYAHYIGMPGYGGGYNYEGMSESTEVKTKHGTFNFK